MNNYTDDKQLDMAMVNNFFEHDYHDRGMMKWQGFYLSDHTAALHKQMAKKQRHYQPKSQQTLATITNILALAYQRHRLIKLQLNQVDINDSQIPDFTAHVLGYHANRIVLDHQQLILLDDIRHVELL